MRVIMPVLVLSLVLAGGAGAQEEERVLLRFGFEPGQELKYEMQAAGQGSLEISSPAFTAATPISVALHMPLQMMVHEVEEGGVGHLAMDFTAANLMVTALGQTWNASLDLAGGLLQMNERRWPFPGEQVRQALGKMEWVTTPRGQVTAVEGFEEFLATVPRREQATARQLSPAEQARQLEELLRTMPPLFPEPALAVGTTWSHSFALPLGEASAEVSRLDMDYTLADIVEEQGGRIARIEVEGDLEIRGLETPGGGAVIGALGAAGPAPAPGRVELLAAQIRGQMYLDLEQGFWSGAGLTVTVNLEASGPNPQGQPGHIGLRDLQLTYTLTQQR